MRILIILVISMFGSSAYAAKPTSVRYVDDVGGHTEEVYKHYIVACSDGTTKEISAWKKRRFWCDGLVMKDPHCFRNQVKAAQKACNSTRALAGISVLE